jgi:hypothetical protein
MTDEQILEKAIKKAIANGWEIKFGGTPLWNAKELAVFIASSISRTGSLVHVYGLIYDSDFAKALWPDQKDDNWKSASEEHLQQMVIAEEPLQYLGANI